MHSLSDGGRQISAQRPFSHWFLRSATGGAVGRLCHHPTGWQRAANGCRLPHCVALATLPGTPEFDPSPHRRVPSRCVEARISAGPHRSGRPRARHGGARRKRLPRDGVGRGWRSPWTRGRGCARHSGKNVRIAQASATWPVRPIDGPSASAVACGVHAVAASARDAYGSRIEGRTGAVDVLGCRSMLAAVRRCFAMPCRPREHGPPLGVARPGSRRKVGDRGCRRVRRESLAHGPEGNRRRGGSGGPRPGGCERGGCGRVSRRPW